MNLSLFLFLIGILGFILNRKNIILMIIAIEIMLLAVTMLILLSSFSFDDGIGQIFSIFIISLAGAEFVSGFLGRKIGVTGSHIITCTCLILSSILATIAFYEVGLSSSPVTVYLFNLI